MKRYKQIEVFHMPIFSSLLVKQQSYNSWYSWSLWCLFVVYIYGALYLFQSLISYFVYEIKITISGCYSTTCNRNNQPYLPLVWLLQRYFHHLLYMIRNIRLIHFHFLLYIGPKHGVENYLVYSFIYVPKGCEVGMNVEDNFQCFNVVYEKACSGIHGRGFVFLYVFWASSSVQLSHT